MNAKRDPASNLRARLRWYEPHGNGRALRRLGLPSVVQPALHGKRCGSAVPPYDTPSRGTGASQCQSGHRRPPHGRRWTEGVSDLERSFSSLWFGAIRTPQSSGVSWDDAVWRRGCRPRRGAPGARRAFGLGKLSERDQEIELARAAARPPRPRRRYPYRARSVPHRSPRCWWRRRRGN